MKSLDEFGLPQPKSVLEHSEYVHLINWLDEFLTPIAKGETSMTTTLLNIDLAKEELQELLPDLLDKHFRNTF